MNRSNDPLYQKPYFIIVIWESEDVLKIPVSALFRHGQDWCVFISSNSRARRRVVEVGHRSAFEAEIRQGVEEGAEIILHPTNAVEDGACIAARKSFSTG